MEVLLLAVGKTKTGFVCDGIAEYVGRLRRYVPFSFVELPDVRVTKTMTEQRQKDLEGELILSRLNSGDFVVLLDEHGHEYSSMEFSAYMEKTMASGKKRALFVVGGPYGFSKDVYARADSKISLSRMTFNHEMVRMFFVEQLYRAMTILRHEPYHHE